MQTPRISDSNESSPLTRIALDVSPLPASSSEETKRLKDILNFSLLTTEHVVNELKNKTFKVSEKRVESHDLEQRILLVMARQVHQAESEFHYRKDQELIKTLDALTSQMSELTAHLSQLNT